MKASLSWLKELVDYNLFPKELADKLSLTSIGVKEQTEDYLELDLTYNRGDLLSLRGIAREIAVITGGKLLFSAANLTHHPKSTTPVQIEDSKLSPVQCVAKIEGLQVRPSDKEWVKKLADCGMKSVNNLVDVTNLIMLEFGQPLHAFDQSSVEDETIIVRVAKNGEEIVTLDGKLRKLNSEDIVLADTQKSLDVAGVMGGKDTEVKESTSTILLSASIFNPVMVRNTSKRLGLASEASKRFQHGLTKTNLLQALSAAIKMYESLGGKLTAITLTGNLEDELKTIKLTQQKINSLIGVDIKPEQVEDYLKKLRFVLTPQDGSWLVTRPYFRLDIEIEEDLIEEVARMYGYERIPAKQLQGELPEKIDQSFPEFIYDLKKALSGAGLTEVQTYSFYSSKTINDLRLTINDLIKIANPISSETEYMRDMIWPNLLEKAAENLKYFKEVVIFEIGKAYQAKPKLKEEYRLSMLLSDSSDNPIQELYQIFQGVYPAHFQGVNRVSPHQEYFHPTRFASLEKDGEQVGWVAEIHPRIANKFGIEKRVAVLEIKI